MIHFHKWTRWETYTRKFSYLPRAGLMEPSIIARYQDGIPCSEERQKRECTVCGKAQDRLLREHE